MVFESKKMRSPQTSVLSSTGTGNGNLAVQKRKASRLTAKVDYDMLGSQKQSSRTKLSLDDEMWIRNALQSRLPIF